MYRFLLTILPAPALTAEVDRLRALLHAEIGSFTGRNTVPHVTLGFLDLPSENEPAICEAVAHGLSGSQGFRLRYDGIRHFPERRTIFIAPVEKEAIGALRASVFHALKADASLRDAVRETEHPHLSIAAGLKPAQFDRAWELLAPHACASEERVTEIVLLKRLLKPGTRYEPVRSFQLG